MSTIVNEPTIDASSSGDVQPVNEEKSNVTNSFDAIDWGNFDDADDGEVFDLDSTPVCPLGDGSESCEACQ